MRPIKREAAVNWLAVQPWFASWTEAPEYNRDRIYWRKIADAVPTEGFYSRNNVTIDIPVYRIVTDAIKLRDTKKGA